MEKKRVGISSVTPFKQADLKRLLSNQVGKVYGVLKKSSKTGGWVEEHAYFIDCSAGDMNPSRETSPRILISELNKFPDMKANLILIEKGKNQSEKLLANLTRGFGLFDDSMVRKGLSVEVVERDLKDYLPNIKNGRYKMGLLYFDPNGFKISDYEAISKFVSYRCNSKIDIILNINTTQIKRNKGVGDKKKGFERYYNVDLKYLLRMLGKKYIWIRDNSRLDCKSRHNFVMVFGTNHPNFKMGKDVDHFKEIDSPEGKEIINKYNYTNDEKNRIKQNKEERAI